MSSSASSDWRRPPEALNASGAGAARGPGPEGREPQGVDPLRPTSSIGPFPRSGPPARVAEEGPCDGFAPGLVRPGRPAEEPKTRVELIHPLTAEEFLSDLQSALRLLPRRLVASIAEQGYRLHVVDSQGVYPLTLEVEEVHDPPLEELQVEASSLAELAGQRGLAPDAEWLGRVLPANPELNVLRDHPAETPLTPGQSLQVPACYGWQGRRVSPAAWSFLTAPRLTNLAGMVINGELAGLKDMQLAIVLWDKVFRRGDGLADWYVLHELGHTTDFSFAFRQPQSWREWRGRLEAAFGQASFLTRYASESPVEYFAEGFAAWATPAGHRRAPRPGVEPEPLARQRYEVDRAVLQERDSELYSLVEEAVRQTGTSKYS